MSNNSSTPMPRRRQIRRAGPPPQDVDQNTDVSLVETLDRVLARGIVAAGLLMALTYIGGDIAQSQLGLPAAAIQVFQGMLLFFLLALDVMTNYRVRFGTAEVV